MQYPLGILSDRMDRRRVAADHLRHHSVCGTAALFASFTHMLLLMLIFLVFGGAIETIYSIANAHSNDRADPGDYVPLSSTLLVAWSAAATIVPLAVDGADARLWRQDLHRCRESWWRRPIWSSRSGGSTSAIRCRRMRAKGSNCVVAQLPNAPADRSVALSAEAESQLQDGRRQP